MSQLSSDPAVLSTSGLSEYVPGRRHADPPARISGVNPDDVPPGGFGRELEHLVGEATGEATEAATEEGIANIRVLDSVEGVTVTVMTMDRVPTRLNLIIEDGIVAKAVFG